MRAMLLQGGVPPKYVGARWDEVLVPDALEWHVPQILASQIRRGRGLFLGGDPGTGKSSLAACIARDVLALSRTLGAPAMPGIAEETTIRWEYVPTMVDELEKDKASRLEVTRRQRFPSLVVWDDFGVDQLANWHIGHLDRIVEWRYAHGGSLIVTTNLTIDDLRSDERLARLVDRWQQMNVPLFLTGESRRGKA